MTQPPHRPDDPVADPDLVGKHALLHARLARLELTLGLPGDGERAGLRMPAWLRQTAGEQRWPVAISVLVLIGLQVATRRELAIGPPYRYVLPVIELALFVVLAVANPTRINRESRILRGLGLTLVAAASVAITVSAGRLIWLLVHDGGKIADHPIPLLVSGGSIWLTNVIVFALWYWELDRGGPAARAAARVRHPDFLFAQMTAPELVAADWEPGFVDYLYLSFTNATAFSPTDTLPLSRWAKLTMMAQSAVSLGTLALVVARAVNIFS